MALISAQGVTKSYGDRRVLAAVDARVNAADRIGLIGPNGEGKTTLLKLLAGLIDPTEGTVRRRRGLRVGYLPQDPPGAEAGTLWEVLAEPFAELRQTGRRMQEVGARLSDAPDEAGLLKRFADLQHAFEAGGGYAIDRRVRTVLTGLGFAAADAARPMDTFSGGQRSRAMLGKLLLLEPDVLLLDEPTGHLDTAAVEWLERYLEGFGSAIVVVSHDRYLLDRVGRATWELAAGRLETYPGNYTAHLAQRRQRRLERLRTWRRQQEHVRKTEEFIRRHHAGSRSKEARGRRRRLERFLREEAVERPGEAGRIHLRLSPAERSGEEVLTARDLVAGHDPARPVVAVGDLQVRRGRRVAVVGANGSGKTTLLRTLLGRLPPLAGEVRLGAKVDPGYLPQTHDALEADRTPLEVVRAAGGPAATAERVRTLLGTLLLTDDDAFRRVGDLSGGERSRVILATLMVRRSNLLVLDEPTNHLDIPSREILQEALSSFAGTVVFVTHDRYLIEAVATDVWAIEDGALQRVAGGWADYLAWRARRAEAAGAPAPAAGRAQRRPRERAKVTHRQRQRLQRRQQRLEEAVAAAEAALGELSEAISAAGLEDRLDDVRRLGEQYREDESRLKRLWDEWAEVTESLGE